MKFWAVPTAVALIGWIFGGPLVGIGVGILVALVLPPWEVWRNQRTYMKLVNAQTKLLDEYDVTEIYSWDTFVMLSNATMGETDPEKSLLLDKDGIATVKRRCPTKAFTAAKRARLTEHGQNKAFHAEHLLTQTKSADCFWCEYDYQSLMSNDANFLRSDGFEAKAQAANLDWAKEFQAHVQHRMDHRIDGDCHRCRYAEMIADSRVCNTTKSDKDGRRSTAEEEAQIQEWIGVRHPDKAGAS